MPMHISDQVLFKLFKLFKESGVSPLCFQMIKTQMEVAKNLEEEEVRILC